MRWKNVVCFNVLCAIRRENDDAGGGGGWCVSRNKSFLCLSNDIFINEIYLWCAQFVFDCQIHSHRLWLWIWRWVKRSDLSLIAFCLLATVSCHFVNVSGHQFVSAMKCVYMKTFVFTNHSMQYNTHVIDILIFLVEIYSSTLFHLWKYD